MSLVLKLIDNLLEDLDSIEKMTQSNNNNNSNIKICNNFINGKFIPPNNNKYMNIISPRDNKLIGKVALSSKEDVNEAVRVAQEAFKKWSKWTIKERMRPLLKLRRLIEENEDELAYIIMKEHGKTRNEALGSIRKGNETVEYACGMPVLIRGNVLEVSNGVQCQDSREPYGVCASIVPFNFPIMVGLWTLPICVALGNVQIVKPSEKVPLTLNYFCELAKKAGIPSGVIQTVNGTIEPVQALIDHENVKAVTFVGSTRVAKLVQQRCGQLSKKCLALGGAKNHLVAHPDCNVDMTTDDILNSFGGCTGQRCMAASVLLLIGKQNKLMETLCEKALTVQADIIQDIEAFKNPPKKRQRSGRKIGPVIDKQSLNRIVSYINDSEKDGAKILVDGRKWLQQYKNTGGNYIGPTIILYNNKDHKGMKDEIFGPVLSVYVCKNKEEAIEIENNNPYGNAACIYTSTGQNAQWFTKRFSAGMIGVNIGVPVPREPFSFGGINNSKFGNHDITGDGGIEFFTWRKKITTKWTPPQKKTWMD